MFSFKIHSIPMNRRWVVWFLIDLAFPNQLSQAHKAIRLIWSSILSLLDQKSLTIALFSFKIHSIRTNSNKWVPMFVLTLLYQISRARHTKPYVSTHLQFHRNCIKQSLIIALFSFKIHSIRINSNKWVLMFVLTFLYQISRASHTKPYVTSDLQF